jgi:hypothetical protein
MKMNLKAKDFAKKEELQNKSTEIDTRTQSKDQTKYG